MNLPPAMTSTQSLLISIVLPLLLHFSPTSLAVVKPHCSPSSCGIIHNISYPFRLEGDPKNCGDTRYELACDDNITSIYIASHKYYVKAINYNRNTIRLVDASINNHDICSFPTVSVNIEAISISYIFRESSLYSYDPSSSRSITFISCPHPLKNSSLFTEIPTYCPSNSSHSHCASNIPRYSYIKVGHLNASEVPHLCGVEVIVMTSWRGFKDLNNVSLSEIHHSLLYGFELMFCPSCLTSSSPTMWEILREPRGVSLLLLLIALATLGVSLPVAIIIGLTGVLVILIISPSEWIDKFNNYLFLREAISFKYDFLIIALPVVCLAIVVCFTLNILVAITVGFAGALVLLILLMESYSSLFLFDSWLTPRIIFTGFCSTIVICAPRIIICPLAVWFLIYKFRRRRLSTFDAIESYLQGDNRLVPIRYSYSDIKKMTKGFQEKLGEGGYGSVYKGKLRSGLHVAVKLLGKCGASDRDFMNEIATIGRVHHVNVVKLVGYCAQGTKRALVYDFMPNGSLEKYLFNREKMCSLNWVTKFEIAVGIARGIQYLHQGCDVQILHFDIKPHNILLDDNFVPKISDFGLAKFFSIDKHAVTMTACRGTTGYVAPELISRSIGVVSYKADVYSFGMVLVEMLSLKGDLIGNNDDPSQYFPYWIYDCFNQGKDIEMLKDIETDGDDSMMKMARKMTIVALWCIQMNPDDRPPMNKVLEMFEGDVERLRIPNYPSQSHQILVNLDQSEITFSTTSTTLHDDVSPSTQIIIQEC